MDCGRRRVAGFVLCVQRIDLVWDCVCFDCVFDLERTVKSKKYTVCLCAGVALVEGWFCVNIFFVLSMRVLFNVRVILNFIMNRIVFAIFSVKSIY